MAQIVKRLEVEEGSSPEEVDHSETNSCAIRSWRMLGGNMRKDRFGSAWKLLPLW